jgi:hypothetical protein
MIRTLIVAALALPTLTTVAVADDARMSNTEFVRASRCLTAANLTILQDDRPNLDVLTARVNAERGVKNDETKKKANAASRRLLIEALQADTPDEISKVRAERNRLCADYLGAPTVAQN